MAFSSKVSIRGDERETLAAIVELQSLTDLNALREVPGFREARLLLSEDRAEAVLLTEWESREDYQTWRRRPDTEALIAHFIKRHPRITFFDVIAAIDIFKSN